MINQVNFPEDGRSSDKIAVEKRKRPINVLADYDNKAVGFSKRNAEYHPACLLARNDLNIAIYISYQTSCQSATLHGSKHDEESEGVEIGACTLACTSLTHSERAVFYPSY